MRRAAVLTVSPSAVYSFRMSVPIVCWNRHTHTHIQTHIHTIKYRCAHPNPHAAGGNADAASETKVPEAIDNPTRCEYRCQHDRSSRVSVQFTSDGIIVMPDRRQAKHKQDDTTLIVHRELVDRAFLQGTLHINRKRLACLRTQSQLHRNHFP